MDRDAPFPVRVPNETAGNFDCVNAPSQYIIVIEAMCSAEKRSAFPRYPRLAGILGGSLFSCAVTASKQRKNSKKTAK